MIGSALVPVFVGGLIVGLLLGVALAWPYAWQEGRDGQT